MLKQTPKKRVLLVRRSSLLLLAFVGVFLLLLTTLNTPKRAYATAANTVNFQARLQSSAGAIVPDGNYNVEFKLYSASSSGSALWAEDYLNSNGKGLNTINGYLSANLGSITAFPSTINWNQPLWLTMNIGGTSTGTPSWDGEMNPRLPLTAVPYAFQANQLGSFNNATSFNSTLAIQGATGGDQNFVIQDQGSAGTFNLLTTNQANASFVQLQTGTPGTQQSGSLNIGGTGIFATALSTAQLTATGQSILGGASNQTQVVIKANSGQSTSNPLLVLKDSTGGELARITADNYSNLFIGNAAGASSNGGVNYNTFIGSSSGSSTTSGRFNAALGYNTLGGNTDGSNNTAFGEAALQNANSAYNSAFGSNAAKNITTGYDNTAFGADSLLSITTGINNTAIGAGAGSTDTGGAFSTSSNIQNATAIGAYAQVQQNNSIVIGSVDTATKVGIGTTEPLNTFSVSPVIDSGNGTSVKASQSGNTVTGTGTAWTTALVGMRFIFADGDSGTVTAVASTTSLTLDSSQSESAQAYRIHSVGFQVTNTGSAYIQSTNSAAFQVQSSAGNTILGVNTSSNSVSITGTAQVNGNLTTSATAGVAAIIQGASDGSHILDLKTSGGGVAAYFDSAGNFTTTHQIDGSLTTASSLSEAYITLNNNNTSSTQSFSNGLRISVTGMANSNGTNSNVNNGIYFPTVAGGTPASINGNTFNGLFFGTGYDSIINYNGTSIVSGTGVLQTAALAGTYTNQVTLNNTSNAYSGAIASLATSVTTPLLQSSGALAIQSTGANNVTLSTNSSSASIVAKTSTNSATGFQIQNASNVALFNLDTTNGTITFGTGNNTLVYTSSGGLVASGTAQHAKQIALTAEYAGAVLDATNDNTCASAYNGIMTSGYDFSNRQNYYKWTTSQTSVQCYDVVVQVPLPTDFASWSSTPVSITDYSSRTSANTVNIELRDTGGNVDSAGNWLDVTPGNANTWTTSTSSALTGTYTAGNTMTIRIRLSGASSSDVRIGNITLNYTSKF